MSIRVNNIRVSIDDYLNKVKEEAAKIAGISIEDIRNFKVLREAIDARQKDRIDFVYHVEFNCDNEEKVALRAGNPNVKLEVHEKDGQIVYGNIKLKNRPIIVGSGPAGLFAGLVMAKNGYKPLILERGGSVEERSNNIKLFWETGELNLNSNIQFGEGGAGTFSDGKLTTRIKDKRCDFVLEEFVRAGAPNEIIYSGKPHIGTDILRDVVKNIRNTIIGLGGDVKFNSRVTDIIVKDGKVTRVRVNDEYDIPAEVVVVAVGHSARDTYEMLMSRGIVFEQKPFAIGVRIEHLQSMIDERQYGKYAGHPRLKAADYRLTFTSKRYQRPCYSFCMCPGGVVVAAASEENRVVTNGMSEYKRDKVNANSAIVVGVYEKDFKSSHPLAGVEFQRYYESLAYRAGGGGYAAPVQLVGDFLKDRKSSKIGKVIPSYTRGYNFGNLKECLPLEVIAVLKEGLLEFNKKIKGFVEYDAVLTGIETRTSSPVRMVRNEGLESTTVAGVYPCGEGAGYAGGIMSAAVDGIKIAERIIEKYAPFEG